MKKWILSIGISLLAINAYSQNDSIFGIVDGQVVYNNPEVLPVFGDCSKAFSRNKEKHTKKLEKCLRDNVHNFISSNQRYPETAREKGISGNVTVEFIVDTLGIVTNIKLLQGVVAGDALNEEALRVLRLMPSWKPGEQNGQKVSTHFRYNIAFVLR